MAKFWCSDCKSYWDERDYERCPCLSQERKQSGSCWEKPLTKVVFRITEKDREFLATCNIKP